MVGKFRFATPTDPDPGVRATAMEVLRRLSPADFVQVTGQTNVVGQATH